ncbi:alpha-2-macroglobulin receptor-associated protein [Agrilus planipennis]|uniref:Alpha-2-macroglobulin receptor-associated protein n=1 Tax=Agrilus planipennis TaxID=224129 RepID=A0A1W4WN30_AGRPL|nr:alpha-2-macroglobulin receptor-associated protein [Agrilus planipennis]
MINIKLKINLLILLSVFSKGVICHNKYSAAANTKHDESTGNTPLNLKTLDKPFRMNKINLLWSKAQIRLSEPKLKSLFGELKIHDKEEVTWKRLRAEGKDKDGLKEAELRQKLINIMKMYNLWEHFDDTSSSEQPKPESDKYINKSLFKDKKLNKLWHKAEMSGFSPLELETLKEEFNHHQNKIDEYYSILKDVKQPESTAESENSVNEKLERFNTIEYNEIPTTNHIQKANMLREKHQEIKEGYDRLQRLAHKGPNSKEFVEPKVQGLWKIALESDFGPEEMESLRIELLHYENRLMKLRHLQVEQVLNEEKHKEKAQLLGEKPNGHILLDDNIKKQTRKVEKLHLDLEAKIMQKHLEL